MSDETDLVLDEIDNSRYRGRIRTIPPSAGYVSLEACNSILQFQQDIVKIFKNSLLTKTGGTHYVGKYERFIVQIKIIPPDGSTGTTPEIRSPIPELISDDEENSNEDSDTNEVPRNV